MAEPEPTNPEPTPVEPEPTPEPTLLSEPAPTPPAEPKPPTVLTEPVSIVKPDGTFVEGWREKLPEGLGKEPCLDTVTDFNNAIKQLVNHKKMVGKDKVVLPNEKSGEDEWNAFFEAIGRPKAHTDYSVPDIPEELSGIFSEDKLNRARERAYKLGATQKQFDAYIEAEMEEVARTIQESEEAEVKAIRDNKLNAEKELRAELGAAFEDHLHWANRVVADYFDSRNDEDGRTRFKEKYGNDPDIIRLLSFVGARSKEHETIIGEMSGKTTSGVQERLDAILNNKDYLNINSGMSKEERQRLTDEAESLRRQLHPAKTG